VAWRVLFHNLGKFDAKFGGILLRTIGLFDHYVLAKVSVHPIGVWQEEEDEWLMMNVACCQLSALLLPLIDDFSDLIYFDRSLPAESRHAIFEYYKSCVQRHLYAREYISNKKSVGFRRRYSAVTQQVRYLSKNPSFTLRINTIFEKFPDAEIVVLVRNPFKAIPSMVSYIARCWRFFATPTVKYPFKKTLTHMCSLHYTYPLKFRKANRRFSKQICVVHYELCVHDLVKSCSDLYSHLGMNITGGMAAVLNEEASLTRHYNSSHRYDLMETCGMTSSQFVQKHRDAFAFFPGYLKKPLSPLPKE